MAAFCCDGDLRGATEIVCPTKYLLTIPYRECFLTLDIEEKS